MTIADYTGIMYSYGDVVQITNKSSYNTFESNLMYTDLGAYSNYGCVIYNDPNTAESHNAFSNNVISGGEYGIYLFGSSAKGGTEFSNTIFNNFVDSSWAAGIYAEYQDSVAIYGNQVFMTDGAYALYLGNGLKGNPSYVINNFLTIQSADGYGIYSYNNLSANFYNNSVNSSSAVNPTAYFISNGTNICKVNSENNIFNNDAGYYAISSASNGLATSNYNDLYSTGDIGYWGTTSVTCTTLADWKKASKKDANSVSGDPVYASPTTGDLHLTALSTVVHKKGTWLSASKNDIDGQARNLTTPDIGGDEIQIDSNDIGATAIISPANGGCGSLNTSVAIKVTNSGLKDQTSFNVHVSVNATTTATIAFKGTLRGLLNAAPHDTILYAVFASKLNTTAGGTYDIVAYTDLSTDKIQVNDTSKASISINSLPSAKFTVANFGACAGSSLNVTDKSTVSGSPTYKYVLLDTKGTHLDSATTQNPSFTSYSTAGSYRIVQYVSNGTCQDSTSLHVQIWNKPKANFGIGKACLGTSTQFKDSSTAGTGAINSYSWDFGNKTTGSTSTPSTTFSATGIYTVTLKVKDVNGCTDSASKPVVIDFINASFTDSLLSADGTADFVASDKSFKSYSWDFGDKTSTGSGDSTTHKYTSNKRYNVTLSVANAKGCTASTSDSFTVLITGLEEMTANKFNLQVYPNPFQSLTNISFTLEKADNVRMEIYDVFGKQVATLANNNSLSAGTYTMQFNSEQYNITSGLYLVRMKIGENIITRQISLVK